MSGVSVMVALGSCSPDMAVPMTVKMPEPMTAPMPSAVSDHGPRLFFSACSGSSESLMSLSIDLRAKNWLGSAGLLAEVSEQWSVIRVRSSALAGADHWPLTTDHSFLLTLRLAADHLLDFLLERAAGGGALGLGGGFFARCALELFALRFVFNLCGVGHDNLFPSNV
jgi:hypothetical protein